MDIKSLLSTAAVAAVVSSVTVGSMVTYVTLQGSTPGTSETGNTHITGTSMAAKFVAIAPSGDAMTATCTTTGDAGKFSANSGMGVVGSSTTSSGVAGQTSGTSARGVQGNAFATTGYTYGGNFSSASSSGTGVRGSATALSGVTFGAYGSVASSSGIGVYGQATSLSGSSYGGYFKSLSTTGRAVYGTANASGGVNYGVYGSAVSSSGYGLFALGRSGASGTKSFRIDHPSDPENRYLMHYSAEGPEPLNLYRGTVKTNAKGEAWVQLPDYYESINKDPSYQLTVIENGDSSAFVQAKVALKIKENRFKIRTSAPNVEVCWEVKAVRNDLWVRRNGAPVEVEKEGPERGKYLHPELYGLPASMGMNVPVEDPQDATGAPELMAQRK